MTDTCEYLPAISFGAGKNRSGALSTMTMTTTKKRICICVLPPILSMLVLIISNHFFRYTVYLFTSVWQFAAIFERFFFKFERLLLTTDTINGKVRFRYVLRVNSRNDRG